MARASQLKLAPAPAEAEDGRRRRGQDNRARIVAAMLDIIREGDGSDGAPGAEQVAERADVGLRTVFRHFKDMDSLYREMSAQIEAELRAVVDQPFVAQDWRGRVLEMVTRRSVGFERIGPFKRAAETVRHRSRFLEDDSMRLVEGLRERLLGELPKDLADDPLKLEALDLLMSWEAWSRLRREQGLTVERARAVLDNAVRRVID